jgi:hypothetical protein
MARSRPLRNTLRYHEPITRIAIPNDFARFLLGYTIVRLFNHFSILKVGNVQIPLIFPDHFKSSIATISSISDNCTRRLNRSVYHCRFLLIVAQVVEQDPFLLSRLPLEYQAETDRRAAAALRVVPSMPITFALRRITVGGGSVRMQASGAAGIGAHCDEALAHVRPPHRDVGQCQCGCVRALVELGLMFI